MQSNTLGIVGPGLMGLGIAQVAAAHGWQVRLLARDAQSAAAAQLRLQAQLQRHVERGRLTTPALAAQLSAVHFHTEMQALADCCIVIESVPEDRALKTRLLRQLEAVIAPDALLASNTSGIPLSGLAQALGQQERLIGLHFFSPVERMRLVEVVRGAQTSARTLERALAWLLTIDRHSVVVRDGPGFFTTRVFAAYLDEAVAMVGEGVAPLLIEEAARANGRAVGPLAVLDEVSLELNLQQARQARSDGLPLRFCRPLAEPVLLRLVSQGRTGRRQGGGFYDSPAQGQGERKLWSGLSAIFPPKASQPELGEVRQRLRCIEALEALHCLEEGVIANADDANTASRLGLGYAEAGAGVLGQLDGLGLAAFVADCAALARLHGPRFAPSPWLQTHATHHPKLSDVHRISK